MYRICVIRGIAGGGVADFSPAGICRRDKKELIKKYFSGVVKLDLRLRGNKFGLEG